MSRLGNINQEPWQSSLLSKNVCLKHFVTRVFLPHIFVTSKKVNIQEAFTYLVIGMVYTLNVCPQTKEMPGTTSAA